MYFEKGGLVRDQNGDSPGRYGDQCFDSMAFALSHFWTSKGHEYHPQINHKIFFCPQPVFMKPDQIETVRSPYLPQELLEKREWKMSTDNEINLFLFCDEIRDGIGMEHIKYRTKERGWKTGNETFISPGYLAELMDWQWLRCLAQVIQVLFFWFPCYWNDGAWEKGEWPIWNAWKKSDGYLQWALIAHKTPWIFRKLIRKTTLKLKLQAYYQPEVVATEGNAKKLYTTMILETHYRMVDAL